jgi:hypothetical protein
MSRQQIDGFLFFFLIDLGFDKDSMWLCKCSGHKLTKKAFVFLTYYYYYYNRIEPADEIMLCNWIQVILLLL